LIAIGNSGSLALAHVVEAHLPEPSPLVRGAAVWALSQLLPARQFAALKAGRLPSESDAEVRTEWEAA